MFSKRVKHYHQWLRSAIPFKAKLDQISSDSVRVQGPTKRPSLGHLYLVSPVKERHRKGRKCKISRALQSPVPSTQASPKVEASHRRRKVQNGNSRVHQDLPDSRGVGIVDRSVGRLPAHPHPPKLKEIPKVLLQGSGVPVHLPPVRASHSPQVFTMIVKEVKLMALSRGLRIHQYLDDWLIRSQSQEEAQVNTQAVVDLTQSLGWIINQEKSELKPTGVFVRGLRTPPRFSPCKTHSREMAQTSGFDPTTQVKTCFDCKMFDVSNWVASLNGENGPGGTPSHEALSVSPQGALEISSVAGQPPSLDRSHCSPPRLVTKSLQCDERCRPSSQRPQYPTLHRRLKQRLGRSLRPKFYKGSVVRSGKTYLATHKFLDQPHGLCVPSYGPPSQGDPKDQIEGGLPGPSRLQGPVPESNSVGPKSSRNLPKWNLSVVLNELTKAPFEPMKDTDLKHLTLKTAFLLALASGKRPSEIHAWVANKVSNLGQWEKVALFPSSDFIAKNQLAREGSQSVSPVTIPALTTIVDRQFKEDRTLCPVRALRFYLDRTKDLSGSRSLLFISFKKGHTSDIRPATLSSWLKQTILLCYKQADQQALDLVQVKAHDIRAFAASKAFYGGVSVDQIMQACHWKAHSTFTNFYLKDLTWSDTDNNIYLGSVVAAQQVLDPSPQTSCPRKEKKGGGGGGHIRYNQVFRSLSQGLGIPLPSRCYG